MAAVPILIPHIVERTETGLFLVPPWTPKPDKRAPFYGLSDEGRAEWADYFDWVKEHAILPAGRRIESQYASPAEVVRIVEEATGGTMQALSGTINQAVEMAVEIANQLENELNIERGARVADAWVAHERIRRLEVRVAQQEGPINTAILHELSNIDQRAQVRILQSEARSQTYAREAVGRPLMENIFQTKQAVQHRADVQHMQSIDHANQLNASTVTQVMTTLAPLAATVRNIAQEVDECMRPMCNTMGPKTDLGRALKALQTGATLALLASVAAMSADDIEDLIRQIAALATNVLEGLEHFLVDGAGTLGGTLAGIGG